MTKKQPSFSNIGIDGRNLGPTGIGRYTRELVTSLAGEHPEITWHLLVNNEEYIDSALLALSNVVTKKVSAGYYSVAEQLRLGDEIDALQLDLIHFPHFNAPAKLRTPFVTTVHDLTLLFYPGRKMWPGKRWFYKQVLKRALTNSNQIITASVDAASDIKKFGRENGMPAVGRKLQIVPHGVSAVFQVKVNKTHLTAGLLDLGIANPYFLIVGGQLIHKNVHRVLEAFTQIMDKEGFSAYKLVIAGERTVPARHLDQVFRRYPQLKDRVEYTGPVSDDELRLLYHGATAFIFASNKEGFGLPILEAFACSCPVITSKQSSMPEVAGNAAWYVDPTKPAAIAQAMQAVAQGGAAVTVKTRAGLNRVKGYNWLKAATATFDVYKKAIPSK